ncbi:MAG: biotin/lipoyl-containing protein, partial [Spirochaetota bacterium]
MVKEIKLPEIAENVSEGTITGVLVKEGDTIEADQGILEMETDKASVEVPAPFGGTVEEILVGAGDEVVVGQAVMKVEAGERGRDEEEAKAEAGEGGRDEEEAKREAGERGTGGEPAGELDRDEGRTPRERAEPKAGVESGGPGASGMGDAAAAERARSADIPASPGTRRLARELGVDITQVDGSGPGGRVSSEDVKAHARRGRGGSAPTAEAGAASTGDRRERITRVRALTAERTTQSWQTVPHVTQHEEADLTLLNEYMKGASPKVEKAGGKLTVTAVLAKLVAHALRVYP